MRSRIQDLERSGNSVVAEMPVHATTVEMGLTHLRDRWQDLLNSIREGKEKLNSAQEFFKLMEESEKFLGDANHAMLAWSRRISTLSSTKDATKIKEEIQK